MGDNKMKSNFIFLILGMIFLMGIVSASIANLGTFKEGSSVQLLQNCNCTFNNITSIVYPNSTMIYETISMTTSDNMNYYYYWNDTSQIGIYTLNGIGNDGGTQSNWQYQFTITPNGDILTTQNSIIYIIIFAVSFLIFFGLLFMGISLPADNRKDEMTGYIIATSNVKYLKLICIGLAYAFAVFLAYLSWMISCSYLTFGFLSSILQFVFDFLAIAALPLFILFVYILIANLVKDNQIVKQLARGFKVRE
jgi:hypothetical protein